MNKFWKIAIYIGLPFSILGTITCICVLFNRPNELGFDYTGVIVGILSLLVTALLGFQIYNALGIQKEMKELEERMDKYEEKSDKKIEELKSERGIMKLSHSRVELDKNSGKAYFTINSNTKWNIYVNNSSKGQSVSGLNVFPLNGNGNATITIEYGSVESENYQQMASISVFYMSYGTELNETITVYRKHLPD